MSVKELRGELQEFAQSKTNSVAVVASMAESKAASVANRASDGYDYTARSKADSAALQGGDSVAQSKADSVATKESEDFSQATSRSLSQSILISVADSKALSNSVVESTNRSLADSKNLSQSVNISTAQSTADGGAPDSIARSMADSAALLGSTGDSKAVSVGTLESSDVSSLQSRDVSQSVLISAESSKNISQSTLISSADSKAVSVSVVGSSNLSSEQSRNTSQSILISVADSKAVSAASAGGGGSGQFDISVHSDAGANATLTNQANAEQFLVNNNRNIWKVDLTNYTQVRLLARVVTASVSVNNPRLYVEYSATFTTTVSSYSDIGASAVNCSLAAVGLIDSGWINLVAGAKADVFVTVLQNGGDAAADPALGSVVIQFK